MSQIRKSLNCRKQTIQALKLDKFFTVLYDLYQGRATLFQWTGGMTGHSPPLTPKVRDYSQGRAPFTSIMEMGVLFHIALYTWHVLQVVCVASYKYCKLHVLQIARVANWTLQHMHFATHAPYNTCTLQHMQFATHAIYMHFETHAICNKFNLKPQRWRQPL